MQTKHPSCTITATTTSVGFLPGILRPQGVVTVEVMLRSPIAARWEVGEAFAYRVSCLPEAQSLRRVEGEDVVRHRYSLQTGLLRSDFLHTQQDQEHRRVID